ncbi:MAG: TusE/DsrC/DsvC family sulfur relay protein [Gammaproteobacteria bacterium]|nr:TusE/DsrC/DsvC family sulfur relay protein [Gammaproteobacteria bacterium]
MLAKKYDIVLPEQDENGLLLNMQQWHEDVALLIAAQNGIDQLTEAHWQFIYALRAYYSEFNVAPPMSLLCRKQGIDTNCVQKLFCNCLTAWRVAGLPDPGEEAKSYLSAM